MFCPSCGNSVKDSLKYCNSCGNRLSKIDERDDSPGKMLDDILDTLFWFAILGLGILVGLVAVLLGREVKTEIVSMIVFAYLGVIFGVSFLLVRQVPKLIDAKLKSWNGQTNVQPPQLAVPTTAQLDEYREPVMSVTDRTTKTLDKVSIERS